MEHRLLRAAALAIVASAVVAPSAGAFSNLWVLPSGRASIASEGKITFSAGGVTVRCELEITFEMRRGPFENRRGETIGRSLVVVLQGCEGGAEISFIPEEWALQVEAILPSGELTAPERITGLLLRIDRFTLQTESFFGMRCLYRGSLGMLSPLTRIGVQEEEFYLYEQGSLRVLEATPLPFLSGSPLCPTSMTIRGSFSGLEEPEQTFSFN